MHKGKKRGPLTDEHKQKISIANTNPPAETRKRMSDSAKIKIFTKEHKMNLSKSGKGKLSDRLKNQVKNGLPIYPIIGNYEKEIIDVLEETIGYTIFRQYKVGKYHIDGYCPNYQLAIEIDGKDHRRDNAINQDKIREDFIKQELGCQFVRIDV